MLQDKKIITKEYTNIFFNKHNKEKKFIYSYHQNHIIGLGVIEFKIYTFKFQKLKKLKKIANQKDFICWCPFYHVDKFWQNIRKEKLEKLAKMN